MKRIQNCPECKKEFFSRMVKVFVFKKRLCPIDKANLMVTMDGNTFNCPICKREYHKEIYSEYDSLGVAIAGSSRNRSEIDKQLATGFIEVEKVAVPEQHMCQKCRNMEHRYLQAGVNREKKVAKGDIPMRSFPKEITNADVYRHDIMQKLKQDYQQEQTKLSQKIQEEERQKQIKSKLAKKLLDTVTEEKKPEG